MPDCIYCPKNHSCANTSVKFCYEYESYIPKVIKEEVHSYDEYTDVLLKMLKDGVLTDSEYHQIISRLNKKHGVEIK